MGGLLSAFTGTLETNPKVADVVIAPLDNAGQIDESLGGARLLQYWPESLSDDKSANWQSKDIPGAPVPLYQWISGGERPLSFTTVFSRDMNGTIGKDIDEDKHNVDIDAAIAWLRMLSMNDYGQVGDMEQAAIAPPTLWMMFSGMDIGYNQRANKALGALWYDDWSNSTGVYCYLTEVSAERTNWFRDGQTRLTTVSLNFVETIQVGGGIYPYGRSDFYAMTKRYTRKPSS
jgi:hypothetical protein